MQIQNNTQNINFSGAFKIKPTETKAIEEIPTLFTQGRQIFSNILEKGDRVFVVRDNYDRRIGKYLKENSIEGVEYYPTINTKSGLDDQEPEGLLALLKEKTDEIKTGIDEILEAISTRKRPAPKIKKPNVQREIERVANSLRLNIENPKVVINNNNFIQIRDAEKNRTIEIFGSNKGTRYVYVRPDSLAEEPIKCIINNQGEIIKQFTTPKDIIKFSKKIRQLKEESLKNA